jgi:hypothetical protein
MPNLGLRIRAPRIHAGLRSLLSHGARIKALEVRYFLGAPTIMWVIVGASSRGPSSNGQPDVEDCKAGSVGEELSAPSDSG